MTNDVTVTDERLRRTLEETCDALETLLSSEPDMPTYQSDYDEAEAQLERSRAILAEQRPAETST